MGESSHFITNTRPFKRHYDALTASIEKEETLQSLKPSFNELVMSNSFDGTSMFPVSPIFSAGHNIAAYNIPSDAGIINDGMKSNKRIARKSSKNFDRFRPYQAEKWNKHFQQLIDFRKENGHCLVPHDFPPNQPLAGWVKRQRHQYKLYLKKRQSFMTRERIKILEDIGFVWDSHEATWHERLAELLQYKQQYGTCLVPSNYLPNLKLATWVKSQRRQYKLYKRGSSSNMSKARIATLEKHGFEWEVRSESKKITMEKALSSLEPADEMTFSNINLEANDDSIEDEDDNEKEETDMMDTLFDFLISEEVISSTKKLEAISSDLESTCEDGDFVDAMFDFLEDDSDSELELEDNAC